MESGAVRVCVCQLGARMHYGVARSFEKRNALSQLYTDICATKGWPRFVGVIPKQYRPDGVRRLAGRIPGGIADERVTAFSSLGIQYQWKLSKARTAADRTSVHLEIGKRFGNRVIKAGFKDATHVYTFSSAGLEIINAANAAGLHTICEQPAAPNEVEQQIMSEEWDRYPGWEAPARCDNEQLKAFATRQWDEWRNAETIVVPSEFVASGMARIGAPAKRCLVVPYGVSDDFDSVSRERHGGPLRVLTVGTVRLQKGPQYTLRAARLLKNSAEFRVVGGVSVLAVARRELAERLELLGQVPRGEVIEHFRWADVFLLPSLCEGMATVVIEALASGLPVVTTPNAGSPVRNGLDGFIVPIRDPESIARHLDQLASDAELLSFMSRNARERAKSFSLEAYGGRLMNALRPSDPDRSSN